MEKKILNIKFIHPDLGIGGAERLIIDAASGLRNLGHNIIVYTSHYDPNHCFEETLDGRVDVKVAGNSIIPNSIFNNKFKVFCAWLRSFHLVSNLIVNKVKADVIVVDQVSAAIPLLKVMGYKVLFYCHYPDKLLTGRETLLKAIYRYPIDKLEEWTTAQADKILVNSNFTLGVFKKAFPSIQQVPEVLYPGIQIANYKLGVDEEVLNDESVIPILSKDKLLITSINRFERKKNIGLAIKAFAEIINDKNKKKKYIKKLRLIIAGGYDIENLENIEHLKELINLTQELNLSYQVYFNSMIDNTLIQGTTQVLFLPSFNEKQRRYLLNNSLCLIYTPTGEHFGIVPIEAMYCKLPVIAVNSGGPKETINHNETGYLTFPSPKEFSNCIRKFVNNPNLAKELGINGNLRVLQKFTSEKFDSKLEHILIKLVNEKGKQRNLFQIITVWAYSLLFLILFLPFVYLGWV
ncbi:putative asparagine-linked glycosylation 2 transcript variant 1 [Neoconidiobolus thromboides FSU 785]|nr:putative asparagine-linked glycosylation 2 transcript variant 1 [Neoconidiobolus thromboides FSU 785]